MEYKKYDEQDGHSYCFGGFPTYELLANRPECAKKIFVSDKLKRNDEWQKIEALAKKHNVQIEQNNRQIERIAQKDNTYIVGVFDKFESKLNGGSAIVLANPSDMGNLGTIMREMRGFGYDNLILIRPCADCFNPKVVRASMGAIFGLNILQFDSFEQFEAFNKLPMYLFMLNGTKNLSTLQDISHPHCLVFGNEATGLPKNYTAKGTSVKIFHSKNIDSLNLGMSAGIAMYEFSKDKFK